MMAGEFALAEGDAPSHQLVEDATERVEVAALVDPTLAAALLRAHVLGRAKDLPGLRDGGLCVEVLGDAKVEHLDAVQRPPFLRPVRFRAS